MAVFDLNWRSIFVMHELQVKDVGALLHVQSPGDFTPCVLARLTYNRARMTAPSTRDLVSNVLHLEEMRL